MSNQAAGVRSRRVGACATHRRDATSRAPAQVPGVAVCRTNARSGHRRNSPGGSVSDRASSESHGPKMALWSRPGVRVGSSGRTCLRCPRTTTSRSSDVVAGARRILTGATHRFGAVSLEAQGDGQRRPCDRTLGRCRHDRRNAECRSSMPGSVWCHRRRIPGGRRCDPGVIPGSLWLQAQAKTCQPGDPIGVTRDGVDHLAPP